MHLYLFLNPNFPDSNIDLVPWELEPSHTWMSVRDFRLGRAITNNFIVKSSYISELHALFTWRQETEEWYITDTSSVGTWLNGVKLTRSEPKLLKPGDKIQFNNLDILRLILMDKPLNMVDTLQNELWVGEGWPRDRNLDPEEDTDTTANLEPLKVMGVDLRYIDDYAAEIVKALHVVSNNWKALLKVGFIIALGFLTFGIFAILWENRDDFALILFKTISSEPNAPVIVEEWTLLPIDQFPEFWDCDRYGCTINQAKKTAVESVLKQATQSLNGVRTVFAVYGDTYRRIASQDAALGQQRLSRDLWRLPLSQPGYQSRTRPFNRKECIQINLTDLPIGSILRIEGPKYNTATLLSCPITRQNGNNYDLTGYITLDLEVEPDVSTEAARATLDKVKQELAAYAQRIEEVMGYVQ